VPAAQWGRQGVLPLPLPRPDAAAAGLAPSCLQHCPGPLSCLAPCSSPGQLPCLVGQHLPGGIMLPMDIGGPQRQHHSCLMLLLPQVGVPQLADAVGV